MIGTFSVPISANRLKEPDGIRWGGVVTWVTGLTFAVSETGYYLNNKLYIAAPATITLDAADATHPRIDVIAVDNTGSVIVIKGTPAADPQKPSVDTTTQIELTFVLIPAGATEPSGVSPEVIYDENVEWTGSASGVVVNFNSATSPFNGVKCADVGSIGTSDKITFTAAAAKNFADYETISLFIKLKAVISKQHFLLMEFFNDGALVSNAVTLNLNGSLDWANVAVAMSAFQFTGTQFNAICLRWSKSGQQVDHAGFYLDLVKLEAGIQQPPVGVDTYVTELDFDEATSELILRQNNNRPELRKVIPAGSGADGKSAYEVAVENGFVGTEAEWLASLVGPAGADGNDGAPGDDGQDGVSTYTYVAYASDAAGTGFSLIPTDLLKYRAEIHVPAPLELPAAGDFAAATWVKYIGDDGTSGGGGSDAPELHLDFEEAGDEFVYNVPYAMKFTSMVCEGTDATLSIALNTNLARYDKLTITATAAGLVSLIGEYLP